MGLDMYARTVRNDWVPENISTPEAEPARYVLEGMGFKIIEDDDEFTNLTDEARKAYFEAMGKCQESAEAQGHFCSDFAYWRKFNNLHGFMERLYRERGGLNVFNCVSIQLNLEDLERLEREASALPATEGFFFGDSFSMNPEGTEEVLAFVTRAKAAIADGHAVFYDSWW